MKHIYYFIGIFFILHELQWLFSPREKAKDLLRYYELQKENKGKKWDKLPNELKDGIKGKIVCLLPLLFWLLIGLFTFQWPVFLLYTVLNIVVFSPIFKLTKNSPAFVIAHWINSVIGVAFGLFVIINAYHIHLDVWQYIKSII